MTRALLQQAFDALVAMQQSAAGMKCGLLICDETIEAIRAELAKPTTTICDDPVVCVVSTSATYGVEPAQQERKPMTYEEIDKAWRSVDYTLPYDVEFRTAVVRAVEDFHHEAQQAEIEKLRRGEFICQKCGLRKDGENQITHDF